MIYFILATKTTPSHFITFNNALVTVFPLANCEQYISCIEEIQFHLLKYSCAEYSKDVEM